MGYDSLEFLKRGVKVTATDLTPSAAALARRHFALEQVSPEDVRVENVLALSFRDNSFAQPDRLVYFIKQHGKAAKVRPDMKVVFFQDWETPEERLAGTTEILRQLASLAENRKAA